MQGKNLEALLAIAQRKQVLDQTGSWAIGSATYLHELKKEIVEVEEELLLSRPSELEEELGDVLWDYLNLLLCLDQEQKISVEQVFKRSVEKFDERISAVEQGISWSDIKAIQTKRKQLWVDWHN